MLAYPKFNYKFAKNYSLSYTINQRIVSKPIKHSIKSISIEFIKIVFQPLGLVIEVGDFFILGLLLDLICLPKTLHHRFQLCLVQYFLY